LSRSHGNEDSPQSTFIDALADAKPIPSWTLGSMPASAALGSLLTIEKLAWISLAPRPCGPLGRRFLLSLRCHQQNSLSFSPCWLQNPRIKSLLREASRIVFCQKRSFSTSCCLPFIDTRCSIRRYAPHEHLQLQRVLLWKVTGGIGSHRTPCRLC